MSLRTELPFSALRRVSVADQLMSLTEKFCGTRHGARYPAARHEGPHATAHLHDEPGLLDREVPMAAGVRHLAIEQPGLVVQVSGREVPMAAGVRHARRLLVLRVVVPEHLAQ